VALEPEMLLLDEPMPAWDVKTSVKISGLIREAARGRNVLMVEHNLSVVADLFDVHQC
jgi:branched-chain amino acid transport system ATP-binding protein